jgi:hypothetical protein
VRTSNHKDNKTFGFRKSRGISWAAERTAASEEGLRRSKWLKTTQCRHYSQSRSWMASRLLFKYHQISRKMIHNLLCRSSVSQQESHCHPERAYSSSVCQWRWNRLVSKRISFNLGYLKVWKAYSSYSKPLVDGWIWKRFHKGRENLSPQLLTEISMYQYNFTKCLIYNENLMNSWGCRNRDMSDLVLCLRLAGTPQRHTALSEQTHSLS